MYLDDAIKLCPEMKELWSNRSHVHELFRNHGIPRHTSCCRLRRRTPDLARYILATAFNPRMHASLGMSLPPLASELALADAKQCIKLAPSWPKGYLRAGRSLMSMERNAEAEAVLRKGRELAPHNETMIDAHKEAKFLAACQARRRHSHPSRPVDYPLSLFITDHLSCTSIP